MLPRGVANAADARSLRLDAACDALATNILTWQYSGLKRTLVKSEAECRSIGVMIRVILQYVSSRLRSRDDYARRLRACSIETSPHSLTHDGMLPLLMLLTR